MSQFGMRFDASKVVTLKMYCLLKYRFILLCGAAVVVDMTSIDPGTKTGSTCSEAVGKIRH